MRILLINTFYYPNMVGGTEQSIKLLAEGLKKRGHEIFVMTGDKKDVEQEVIEGINIIRLNLSNNLKRWPLKVVRKCLEFNNIVLHKKIEGILDSIKPDIIHTNNLFYISPIVWKIANEKGIKVIHTLRDYWGLCPKTTLLNSKNGVCCKKNFLCKFHINNYKKYSKYVDIVTSPSKFTLELYNKNNMFQTPNKFVISNAIDIDHEKCRSVFLKKNMREDDIIKFLFIGTIGIHKGIKFLIDSFQSIDNENIRLLICGSGELTDYVIEKSKEDKRIRYIGKVMGSEKERILLESDVMVVPSIWYEPFGRVVIEGYKYSMPIIASKIGGINELLFKDVSIGVEPNNNVNLEDAIRYFSNRNTIKKYISNIQKYLPRYEIETQVEKFEKVYVV